ncbi:MAG TPA: cytochrome c oxidase subunit II [Gemmatimonadaceae bacterium]|nr:cytochrome c oxidase subunit II [Gemmatimonadaceae bacterium]
MKGNSRLRQIITPGLIIMFGLVFAAGAQMQHPNTTFQPHSEVGRSIDFLWDRLMLLGTIVFVLVEGALLYVVFRYRSKGNETTRPPQTHGHAFLEILWTLIPAFILIFIAVPTVRIIFQTQAKVAAGALQIEVIGHQWWWEFRYPEYNITTANEIYLPVGRTVNFKLNSVDVIHSFWTPQLGGKRDVIANRTNYIWYTPDSTMKSAVWNGFCTEYCGTSHAKMRFRVFTVQPAEFASWVAGQQKPAAFGAVASATAAQAGAEPKTSGIGAEGGNAPAVARPAGTVTPGSDTIAAPAPSNGAQLASLPAGYTFPREVAEFDYAKPHTPIPGDLSFTKGLTGSAAKGMQTFSSSACIGCHMINGNPSAVGNSGPNLTHIGSRATLGAGSFPNTPAYLALWIKNARKMKPGILMPTLGLNEYDPRQKAQVTKAMGGLDDQQIADIVAYLSSLK